MTNLILPAMNTSLRLGRKETNHCLEPGKAFEFNSIVALHWVFRYNSGKYLPTRWIRLYITYAYVLSTYILSVCPGLIFFCIFTCCVLFGVLLEGMVDSSLLSKDESLTPNIDKVIGVWNFRRRAQIQRLAKSGLLKFSFWIYLQFPK